MATGGIETHNKDSSMMKYEMQKSHVKYEMQKGHTVMAPCMQLKLLFLLFSNIQSLTSHEEAHLRLELLIPCHVIHDNTIHPLGISILSG